VSTFPEHFLEEMKPIALNRIKGGVLRRFFLGGGGGRFGGVERDLGQKFTRRSYFSAVHEAGKRMTEAERAAWLEDGTLPDGFWEWVDKEAASWDSLPY
jgi:hypothetical protein